MHINTWLDIFLLWAILGGKKKKKKNQTLSSLKFRCNAITNLHYFKKQNTTTKMFQTKFDQ